MLRKRIFTLHMFAGLAAAFFVVVLGLTGSIMAFEEEIDHATHPHLFYVDAQGRAALSLSALSTRLGPSLPGRVVAYGMGVTPNLSYYLATSEGIVFVNQYTGEILGIRSGPTWLSNVHQIHLRLLAGDTGKTIVSWAGLITLLLAASGLYLWWPVKRVSIDASAGGRRVWFDLHNAVGVFSFAFLIVLAFTGAIIGFERVTTPWIYKVTASRPYPGNLPVTPVPGAKPIAPEDAVAIATGALPGATAIAVNVTSGKAPYRVALRYPEDLTPGGRSRVFVNPYSGAVLQAESSRATAAGTRVVIVNRAVHTGDLFGTPTKILMSLASLAAVAQAVTGMLMWWKRPRAVRNRKAVVAPR
jgi:uncharacterized iron-regulated membrane protein